MIVFRIAKKKWIKDLSGIGAKLTGGRWNPKGLPVLYCASNSSLAMLEKLVNIDYDLLPDDLFIAEIEIPETSLKTIDKASLDKNWNKYPSPDKLKSIGKDWINNSEFLILEVPSAVNPNESNYLINVNHKMIDQVKVIKTYPIVIDGRLKK